MNSKSSCVNLQLAVIAGNYKKSTEIINEYGLKVDDSWTDYDILFDAVRSGNQKIVQLLLNHGCRVNKPRANVYTPLHLAVEKDYREIVEILLKHGASVKAKCQKQNTPLHVTIKTMSPEVVKLLLAFDANVCAKNLDNYTPIHRAFSNRNGHKIIDLMLAAHEGKLSDNINTRGMSIFHIACTRNQPTVVENFLQRNTDVDVCVDMNAAAWNGMTGLHLAALYSQEAVVQVLLKYKANVNKHCVYGWTPLWWALRYSFNDEIADKLNARLIKNKTTLEEVKVPWTIIMKFMSQEIKKTQTIQLLVENKSEINFVTEDGCPLLLEAYHPNITWDFSDDIPNMPMIRGICSRFFIESRNKTMKMLLDHSIDVNVVNKDKNSILHLIAEDTEPMTGSLEIAEIILKKGAEPNVKNNKGETPLHRAVKNGFSHYVYLLLKYKANPNSADQNLRTPLHDAKDKSVIDLLIRSGANVNAKDKKGFTPSLNSNGGEDCRVS